jgi:hypothetical protein
MTSPARPKSHAAQYLAARASSGRNHPAISEWVRSARLVEAAFEGLIARLRAEGWTDEVIQAALSKVWDRPSRMNPASESVTRHDCE